MVEEEVVVISNDHEFADAVSHGGNKMVEIDEERIKKLNAKGRLTEKLYKEENYDALREETLQKISEEFARKLAEYHKIDFGEDENGLWFDASLEIIVPPTPRATKRSRLRARP